MKTFPKRFFVVLLSLVLFALPASLFATSVFARNAAPNTHHYHLYVNGSKHAKVVENDGITVAIPNCTTPVPPAISCYVNEPATVDFTVNIYSILPNGIFDLQSDLPDRCNAVTITPNTDSVDGASNDLGDVQVNAEGNRTVFVHGEDCVPNEVGSTNENDFYVHLVSDGRDGSAYNVNFKITE